MADNNKETGTAALLIALTFVLAVVVFCAMSYSQYLVCIEEGYSSTYCGTAYDIISCESIER